MNKAEIKRTIRDLELSIKQIANKKNKLLFFVADSQGTPIGSLTYTYGIAYRLKELGYNVQMLYAEKDFKGVGSWLGEEYAALPHFNVTKDIVDVAPSDILFIPELCSAIMPKAKELHCKRVAILENFNYMTELIPFGASWESMGIRDCIVTSKALEKRLLEVFPDIKTYVIHPVINPVLFVGSNEQKKLIVNIVTKDEKNVNNIFKPFKWRHPEYGFVTFRYISGKSQKELSELLNEGTITVWIDPETDFGYTALEAMACGNIVIGKIPENTPEWLVTEDGRLRNNGVWFYNTVRELPDILADVLNAVLHEGVPEEIYTEAQDVLKNYTQELQDADIKEVIEKGILEIRTKELTLAKSVFKENLEKENKTEE